MSEPAVDHGNAPRDPRGGSEPVIPAPSGTAPPDWNALRDGLPEDIRESPFMQMNHKSLEDTLRASIAQHRLVGMDKVARPKMDSPKEDWDTFYNSMGRPESADKYDLGDFAPPEGVQWDADLQGKMVEAWHKRGLSNEQVKGSLHDYAEIQAGVVRDHNEQMQQRRVEAETSLREEWGRSYDQRAKLADDELNRIFGDAAAEVVRYANPDGALFGNDPKVIKGLYELAKMHTEAKMIGESNVAEPSLSPAAAKAEYEAMEANPEIAKILGKADPKSPEVKRWNMLYDFAHPGGVG